MEVVDLTSCAKCDAPLPPAAGEKVRVCDCGTGAACRGVARETADGELVKYRICEPCWRESRAACVFR